MKSIKIDNTRSEFALNGYAGVPYLVHTPTGRMIIIYTRVGYSAYSMHYAYSDDDGLSWVHARLDVSIANVITCSIWYDRWSGIDAELIHIAYLTTQGHDVRYLTLDASSLATTTAVTAFNGTSATTGAWLSITRARGGNLILCGQIDAAAEVFSLKSTAVGASASFSSVSSVTEATQDRGILLPGWNADTQDVMCLFWDASADEISVKRYDDSANTWTETSISTSMVDSTTYTTWSAAVDIDNSRNVIVAWSNTDSLNADLRCWVVDDTTITETSTNVVLNSTDDQGLAALSVGVYDGVWTVYYCGLSGGSETFPSSVSLCCKKSTDSGATWSSESVLLSAEGRYCLIPAPRTYNRDMVAAVQLDASSEYNVEVICRPFGRGVNGQIGMN